ncbi:MAG TPA: CDP-alcohol phosphatidyltransferase family protein [Mycobacteriales bacterium]|nr:CDP-alcohol phosphatidyltransferase family protein [Mycobacteriales bacterium]
MRTGPVLGLATQVAVLGALALTIGLSSAAWAAGLAFGLVTWGVLREVELGPADRVTLARATLVGGVLALTVDSLTRPIPAAGVVPLAAVALSLDAVDGWVARRTGTASELGARFDMEVEAFLILVLSVLVARPVGAWVLAIGLMRYGFVAAGWALPWLRDPIPRRYWAKVVAAVQGIALVVAASGLLPRGWVVVMVGVALVLLVESFGRSVSLLWRHRTGEGASLEFLSGGPVRRGRHADPAVGQRRDAAA